jgi:hypothetical protein
MLAEHAPKKAGGLFSAKYFTDHLFVWDYYSKTRRECGVLPEASIEDLLSHK